MLRIVTVSTHPGGYFDALMKGCARSGIKVDVLGHKSQYYGEAWKLLMFQDHLYTLPEDEFVVCMDSHDMLMGPFHEHDIINRFSEFNKKIVFSVDGEAPDLIHSYFQWRTAAKCGQNYLNPGAFMGRVESLRTLLNTWTSTETLYVNSSDQGLLARSYATSEWMKENIAADVEHYIFHTSSCGFFSNQIRLNSKLQNQNGKVPIFLHGSGNCDLSVAARTWDLDARIYSRVTPSPFAKALGSHSTIFVIEIQILIILVGFCIFKCLQQVLKR